MKASHNKLVLNTSKIGLFLLLSIFIQTYRVQAQTVNVTTSEAGKWYRIAENTSTDGRGDRANAKFTLWDRIPGGGHSTVTFIAGSSYNRKVDISFTMLNHNTYNLSTFTKVRILTDSIYARQYLEVFVNRAGTVYFQIEDNVQHNGWIPVNWQDGAVPAGYEISEYDIDNLFTVGDYQNRLTVNRGGNVGIGTDVTPANLTIYDYSSDQPVGISLQHSTYNRFWIGEDGSFMHIGGKGGTMPESGAINIFQNGNVGIGTTNLATYKLSVKGKIGASGIKITDVSSWADFVFEPTYRLRPLEEVESFIEANGHLPEIPSEKEVKANGMDIGEMDAKLLQKIEELTLYTIEQERKINALEAENERLRLLEERLQKLEELVK